MLLIVPHYFLTIDRSKRSEAENFGGKANVATGHERRDRYATMIPIFARN
jgi:hypothetical protein